MPDWQRLRNIFINFQTDNGQQRTANKVFAKAGLTEVIGH